MLPHPWEFPALFLLSAERAAICIIDKEAENLKGQHSEAASDTSFNTGLHTMAGLTDRAG